MNLYPSASIQNLTILGLDHASILLNTGHTGWNVKHVPIKFEAKWLLNEDFLNLVKDIWLLHVKRSHLY